jgi:hypothetical protein
VFFVFASCSFFFFEINNSDGIDSDEADWQVCYALNVYIENYFVAIVCVKCKIKETIKKKQNALSYA